jgi:hypothetical protein
MFYVIIFGILAILLVVAGLTAMSRRGRQPSSSGGSQTHRSGQDTNRRNQKAARAQSQHDRRKRH